MCFAKCPAAWRWKNSIRLLGRSAFQSLFRPSGLFRIIRWSCASLHFFAGQLFLVASLEKLDSMVLLPRPSGLLGVLDPVDVYMNCVVFLHRKWTAFPMGHRRHARASMCSLGMYICAGGSMKCLHLRQHLWSLLSSPSYCLASC